MVAFEELQELWRSQPAAGLEAGGVRATELTEAFRRYGRRQNYFNVFRLLIVSLQVFSWMRVRQPRTPVTLCGMAIVLLGELFFLFSDWRQQLGIARLNFAEPSLEFVRNAIERLYDQRNPFRAHAWFLAVTIGAGLNLLVLGREQHLAPLERIAYHLSACAAPFAMFVVGLRIRGKRWRRQCLPLVERLQAIERALRESEL